MTQGHRRNYTTLTDVTWAETEDALTPVHQLPRIAMGKADDA